MVENEIPNPLASDILADAKAIMGMLKEMGLTPKSSTNTDAGENDLASLSKAMQIEESKAQDLKHVTDLKRERYRERGAIESREQLLAMLDEKQQFDGKLKRVLNGDAPPEGEKIEAVPSDEPKNSEPEKVLVKPSGTGVEVPDDVKAILERMQKKP
jgi:predicted RNA-binding protein